MSRRTLVGGLTDGGTYVTYVHNGAHLGSLIGLINRDGVHTVLGTLLTARDGGWSYLDPHEDGTRDHLLGERGRSVPGYGVAYTDAQTPNSMPVRFPFPDGWSDNFWADEVLLIEDDGSIRFAECEHRCGCECGECECDCGPQTWEWRQWPPRVEVNA